MHEMNYDDLTLTMLGDAVAATFEASTDCPAGVAVILISLGSPATFKGALLAAMPLAGDVGAGCCCFTWPEAISFCSCAAESWTGLPSALRTITLCTCCCSGG